MDAKLSSRSSFTTTHGHEYSYVYTPAIHKHKPTILFLHGFPSHLPDWTHQILHFSSLGYGVIAPDLLGYGQSSKSTDPQAYRLKAVSDELIELLDHLDISKAVGVGHDVGATLLSRLAAFHPSRWLAFAFLAVGPPKLGTPFNLDLINSMTKKMMGIELLGYISWMSREEAAQQTLEQHAEASMSLMFAAESNRVWNEWFHPLGKMKQFVSEDRRVPVGDWYTEELQHSHLEVFGSKGGYTGAVQWYRMWTDNLFAKDEVDFQEFVIKQPSLFVIPNEPAASAAQQEGMIAQWTSDLTVVTVDSGHWVHIERAAETNHAIEQLIQGLPMS